VGTYLFFGLYVPPFFNTLADTQDDDRRLEGFTSARSSDQKRFVYPTKDRSRHLYPFKASIEQICHAPSGVEGCPAAQTGTAGSTTRDSIRFDLWTFASPRYGLHSRVDPYRINAPRIYGGTWADWALYPLRKGGAPRP